MNDTHPDAIGSIDDIEALFYRLGARRYAGESVSQLEHALQAAHAAERVGAGDALVTAALLHDIGHFAELRSVVPTASSGVLGDVAVDLRHEVLALALLDGSFGDDVLGPIRLHVDAKRYLCAVDGAYRTRLSPGSVRSLYLQGGAFDAREAEAFEDRPHARTAILLRRWDDAAKCPGAVTPSLEHFLERARRCCLARA
ncbi:MAG: HD domain-containing protein [Lautropia sp.]